MTSQKKENRNNRPAGSCDSGHETKKKDRIGVLFYGNEEADFFKSVYKGVETVASSLDAKPELILKHSPMNASEQARCVRELLSEGIKGLLIAPVDDPEVADAVRAVSSAHIPVVTVHTDIENTGRIAYVGTDPYKAGMAAAAQMCQLCDAGTEIGIVTGFRHIKGHEQRVRGFCDYIEKSDKHLIVEYIGECRDDDYKAYELVQKMMSDHPGISAFFFSTTGGIYGGCKGIFTMTTRLKFHVVTFDVFPATREFMRKGLIDSSIYQNPMHQGAHAMRILAQKVYEGRDPSKEINLEELSIKTKECLYL